MIRQPATRRRCFREQSGFDDGAARHHEHSLFGYGETATIFGRVETDRNPGTDADTLVESK